MYMYYTYYSFLHGLEIACFFFFFNHTKCLIQKTKCACIHQTIQRTTKQDQPILFKRLLLTPGQFIMTLIICTPQIEWNENVKQHINHMVVKL